MSKVAHSDIVTSIAQAMEKVRTVRATIRKAKRSMRGLRRNPRAVTEYIHAARQEIAPLIHLADEFEAARAELVQIGKQIAETKETIPNIDIDDIVRFSANWTNHLSAADRKLKDAYNVSRRTHAMDEISSRDTHGRKMRSKWDYGRYKDLQKYLKGTDNELVEFLKHLQELYEAELDIQKESKPKRKK